MNEHDYMSVGHVSNYHRCARCGDARLESNATLTEFFIVVAPLRPGGELVQRRIAQERPCPISAEDMLRGELHEMERRLPGLLKETMRYTSELKDVQDRIERIRTRLGSKDGST